MYKLTNILSEIKIIKNITPEMVKELWIKRASELIGTDDSRYKKARAILVKYGRDINSHLRFISWLETLKQEQLKDIYNVLSQI